MQQFHRQEHYAPAYVIFEVYVILAQNLKSVRKRHRFLIDMAHSVRIMYTMITAFDDTLAAYLNSGRKDIHLRKLIEVEVREMRKMGRCKRLALRDEFPAPLLVD